MKEDTTHEVPALIGAALMTERTQFVKMASAQIRKGTLVLTPEATAEIVDLLVGLIDDRAEQRVKLREATRALLEVRRTLQGQARVIDQMRANLDNIEAGPEEEDTDASVSATA
jgi:hypothetical protein